MLGGRQAFNVAYLEQVPKKWGAPELLGSLPDVRLTRMGDLGKISALEQAHQDTLGQLVERAIEEHALAGLGR